MRSIDEDDCDYWIPNIDHSQDVEIRTNKEGKMFAIKNIRQEFEGNMMIFRADVSGDTDAANQYLKHLGELLLNSMK
jgi:hypothetical protein